jgi:hypothetical protein
LGFHNRIIPQRSIGDERKIMHRRSGLISLAAASSLLLCAANSTSGCNSSGHIGPSTGEIVGATVGIAAAVVVGTVVLVEVNKSHHTIKGCVTAGPDGILVHNESDQKIYSLSGVTAEVKVGDVVKVHGSKEKNQKDSSSDIGFVVARMSRDYGPCKAALAAPASPTGSNPAQ